MPASQQASKPASSRQPASELTYLQRVALQRQQEDAADRPVAGSPTSLESAWFGFSLSDGDLSAFCYSPAASTAAPWFLSNFEEPSADYATAENAAAVATNTVAADSVPNVATSTPSSTATNFLPTGATASTGWTEPFFLPATPAATVASNRVFASPAAVSSSVTLPSTSAFRPEEQRITRVARPDLFTSHAFVPAVTALPGTSGTLTAVATAYNYSTAPWVITSGTGTYPDSGGIATLNPVTSPTPGTIITGTTVTIDVSPDLSQIAYNSPFSYSLAAGTGTSIVADPTAGLTLNAINTATNSPTNFFTTANTISSPISGGGAAGLTKTGGGIVTLTGTNTYTGGTAINGGFLVIASTAAIGDAVLGATGAGNGLSFNGGTLFTNVTGGLTTARNIALGANGGTIQEDTAFTDSGVVSGSGSLSINGFGATAVTLTNTETYTGATITSLSTASALTLSGNGSIATSSSYDLSGTLTLDNSGTTGVNRLNDTGAIAVRGAFITTTGNATTASAETAGALTLANGISTVNVTPGTAGSSLNFASLARQNGALLFVRGTNLGATPGAGNSTITAGTSPTLIGGGGAAGSTTISIVPTVIGNLTASTTATNTVANSVSSGFVTYDPTNGFRPLATAEYATALGVNATDNVRLTAATAATAGMTENSVLFAPAAAATLPGGPINVTSGAFMYSPTTGTGAGTVSAGLNFGTAEGVITATNPLTVSGVITGSGGLTIGSPTVSAITITGANTYTGTTNLVASQTLFTGAVANDGVTAGPFGLSTTPITLNAGLGYVLLSPTATTTFARNLLIAGNASPGLDYFGTFTSGTQMTDSGNIDVEHNLTVIGGSTLANALTLNGTISGPAGLVGFSTSEFITINGNNTFAGGINAQGDTFLAGSDTAFGTGTIFTSASSTFEGTGTAARNIANNFVTLATATFAGTAPLNLTGTFNLNGSRTLTISNTAGTTFAGVVSNGAITKGGAGTIFFNSSTGNTFTGGLTNTGSATTASAIYANNTSGLAFGTGAVNIGAASATTFSTLAGNFTTSGATSIAGRLSPGNGTGLTAATAGIGSIGALTFNSNLTLSSATTSSLYTEIASGTSYDTVTVGGAFTLNGTVYLATTSGYTIQPGDVYTIVNAGSITQGTFTFNTTGATLASGVTLTEAVTGTQIIVSATSVPEPATVLGGMLTAGLLGLGLRRRLRTC